MITNTLTSIRRVGLPAAALLLTVALTGCQPRPEVQSDYAGDMVRPGDLVGATVAVGGVVAGTGVELDPQAPSGDSDEWAASLYAHLLAQPLDLRAVPAPMVADLAGGALALLRAEYAARGPLNRHLLDELKSAVPRARYLALARIEKDDVTFRTRDYAGIPEQQREARPSDLVREPLPNMPPAGRRVRRALTVEFDLFDLASGATVWSATVERRREIVVEHFSPDKAGDVELAPADSTGAERRFVAPTVDLSGLDAARLVDDCLGALIADLGRAPDGESPRN